MIIGVFGIRDDPKNSREVYSNYNAVATILNGLDDVSKIFTGGGKGVEQLTLRYAEERSIPQEVIPPNIEKFGQHAAFDDRNERLLERIDMAVLLWSGNERYLIKLIRECAFRNKTLLIFPV